MSNDEDVLLEKDIYFAAAKTGNVDTLEESKVSVTTVDEFGNTGLHWAAGAGHIDAVQFLVEKRKADVNAQNKNGDTPLHKAAWRGSYEVVKYLANLDNIDLNKKNNQGKKAVDIAYNLEVKSLLQSYEGVDDGVEGGDESSEEERDDVNTTTKKKVPPPLPSRKKK